MGDPRAVHAPEAYESLRRLEAAVAGAVPTDALATARQRVAMSLGREQWVASSSPDPMVTFTEQFVVDVTGVDLAPLATALGPAVLAFVQGLWVVDQGLRADIAVARLFGGPVPARDTSVAHQGLDVEFDGFLKAVARLDALDPVTTELVRLRGARFHGCRLCQSRRAVQALREGADEAMFDDVDRYDTSDLAERHKVALRLTDAIVTRPDSISDELVRDAHAHLGEAALVELVLDVMRNAANKVAVAFGADAPQVADGVELFDVLPDGDLVYGLPEDAAGR